MTSEETRQPLTLDEVTNRAVEEFRARLERGAWALDEDETDGVMREIADDAVPGDNSALLEIVANSGPKGLGLLYFDSETGASNARNILAEAVIDHVMDALESELRTFEQEQEDEEDQEDQEDEFDTATGACLTCGGHHLPGECPVDEEDPPIATFVMYGDGTTHQIDLDDEPSGRQVCRACGADLSREDHAPNCENAPGE